MYRSARAPLDIASGFVIGKCYKRHRAAEFLSFLKQIDARVAEGLEVHIVMDNYATHKTPKIKAWLTRRPIIMSTSRRLRHRGSTRSSAGSPISLESDSGAASYLSQAARGRHPHLHRQAQRNPKPFKWVKSADQILASVKRFCQKTPQTLCREL